MKKRSEWAKLPIRWIHAGGLNTFIDRSARIEDERLRNECIASLRLYLVLCCRADFNTGLTKITYPEMILLAKMSRATISRSIRRLEREGLIQRQAQALKLGSAIIIQDWNEGSAWGKIPNRKLYDGNYDRMLLLAEFNYSKASFYALKVYIGILAYRDKSQAGIATISYDAISSATSVPRHHIADSITQLYQMNLISFRQGDYKSLDAMNRTNRYLVKGLGSYWPEADISKTAHLDD